MATPEITADIAVTPPRKEPRATGTLARLAKYAAVKGLMLGMTLVVGLYLTILVVNLGGYADEMHRGQIINSVTGMLLGGWLADVPPDERQVIVNETIFQMEEARGLHQPFLLRTGIWLTQSLVLNFEDGGAAKGTILARLPYTVALVGATNLAVFLMSIPLALVLARRRSRLLNRLTVFLSPLTFAPPWVHGAILITIFTGWLRVIPHPDQLSTFWGTSYTVTLQAMLLPATAIFISAFFQSVYTWRSFFLGSHEEDYVELAKAKGLRPALLERRYILRPAMPYVITSFALLALTLWQDAMALEWMFRWPGIGLLFLSAAQRLHLPLVMGVVVIFAYLLVITVFLLDIFYALLDPRVRVGGEGSLHLKKRLGLRETLRKRLSSVRQRPVRKQKERWYPVMEQEKSQPESVSAAFRENKRRWGQALQPLLRYPSGLFGLAGIAVLVVISIYTLTSVPYERAVQLWRGQGGDLYQSNWYQNPVNAPPVWMNVFRSEKLPSTIVLDSERRQVDKQRTVITDDMTEISMTFAFRYPYDAFPQEISLFFRAEYEEKLPLVSMTWRNPEGRAIDLGSMRIVRRQAYHIQTDSRLQRKLGGLMPITALFEDPFAEAPAAMRGTYELEVKAFVFEPQAEVEAEMVVYGQVHGLAGTDSRRRDPMLGLLWGTVLALSFGISGAIGTSLAAMLLAAVGVWFGGWMDGFIQRITEVNLILPKLVVLILIYILYSKSIWAILGVLVLLNVFGPIIKSYRAVFLQTKQAPYVEAAQAYGASSWRIIRRYLVPRVLPVMIPQIVILIPGYMFYEATLAVLGVRDMYLPTWGKIIFEALTGDALLRGQWWQLLVPLGLLSLTAMAFALFGYALERILNPSLNVE
jgi:peptide/nickel transport system permease protein